LQVAALDGRRHPAGELIGRAGEHGTIGATHETTT
jgi:hypothetical protein